MAADINTPFARPGARSMRHASTLTCCRSSAATPRSGTSMATGKRSSRRLTSLKGPFHLAPPGGAIQFPRATAMLVTLARPQAQTIQTALRPMRTAAIHFLVGLTVHSAPISRCHSTTVMASISVQSADEYPDVCHGGQSACADSTWRVGVALAMGCRTKPAGRCLLCAFRSTSACSIVSS